MRILVTGANGQLGTELMALLGAADHHEVLGLDLPDHDLTDRDHVLAVITQWRPEAIIHGAAFTAVDVCETEVELAHRVNCLATRFVADGARRVGAHVVYVSTDYVFDGTKAEPYVEWDRPNPQSVYGRTKLGGESEIDPGWTIARTSWVCGEHGQNMVKTAAATGRRATATCSSSTTSAGTRPSPRTWRRWSPSSRSSGSRACSTPPTRARSAGTSSPARSSPQPAPTPNGVAHLHRRARPAPAGTPAGQLGARRPRVARPRLRAEPGLPRAARRTGPRPHDLTASSDPLSAADRNRQFADRTGRGVRLRGGAAT